MTDALIALAFGFFVILVVLPAVALLVFTALDVLWRIDIGFSKFVWLPLVLFVPVGGALLYWLLRPKDFDPWTEKPPAPVATALPSRAIEPGIMAAAGIRPAPRMAALQGGADPEPREDDNNSQHGSNHTP